MKNAGKIKQAKEAMTQKNAQKQQVAIKKKALNDNLANIVD